MLHDLGEQSNDLPFKVGEVLMIIEPCNVVYWYLAENSSGKRGIIPITYILVSKLVIMQVVQVVTSLYASWIIGADPWRGHS